MFDESDESGDDSFDEGFEPAPRKDVPPKGPAVVVGAKHIQQLRDVLGLDAFEKKRETRVRKKKAQKARRKLAASGGAAIQTIASRQAGQPAAELVAYTDYRKLKKLRGKAEVTEAERPGQRPPGGQEVTLQQARFEVFKLGVSAMDKEAKEDAQTALAIRLGAKPAKEKGLPYAELKEERAKEKEELLQKEEERKNSMAGVQKKAKGSSDKGKAGKAKSKKKSSSGMKVGSFDGGMLKLSSKELSRLKGKK
jgi:hypothetical protein